MNGVRKHEKFIEAHPEVKAWLQNRPESTRRNFASQLEIFCKTIKVTPEAWRRLDKFEARDVAWKFIQPKIAEHASVAKSYLTTLKSWFRNLDGEPLPFDSGRGGKHYIHVTYRKHATEHIPNKKEMYQIIDMASSLRDKTLLLFLFQSGVRVNVLEHIQYSDVSDELEEEIITLKVTGRLDLKLRGRNIPFYYTFLNGEGAETLRQYCKHHHKERNPEKPLFFTKRRSKPVTQTWVYRIVKMCAGRAGFNPKTMSTHTIRKAFRKIVRQTNVDDDDKEQLMGHVIGGSRQAYFDSKDVELIRNAYLNCNFTREIPQSNHARLRTEMEELRAENLTLHQRLDMIENLLKKYLEKSND